jgi:hypothetical protein
MRYRLILLETQNNCLNHGTEYYFTVIYKKGDETDLVITETRYSSSTHKTSSNILPSRLIPYADEITKVTKRNFESTCQLPTRYSTFLISVSGGDRNTVQEHISYSKTSGELVFPFREVPYITKFGTIHQNGFIN